MSEKLLHLSHLAMILLASPGLSAQISPAPAASAPAAADSRSAWCTTQWSGFSVITNLAQPEVSTLLGTLNVFEPIAERYLPGSPVAERAPMRMLIFAEYRDFRDVFGSVKFAGYMQPSLVTNTLIIAPNRRGTKLTEIALHEYSHYLLRNRMDVSLPLWFDEGLASFLSTITFRDQEATIGKLPRSQMQALFDRGRLSGVTLSQALNADYLLDWHPERIAAFYDWSWLLAHYLLLAEATAPNRGGLQAWIAERPEPLTEFLGMNRRTLERKLRRYIQVRTPTITEATAPPQTDLAGAAWQCLDTLERDLVLSRALLDHRPQRALDRVDKHLEDHPDDSRLLVLAARAEAQLGNREQALAFATRARQLAPEDPETIVTLADQLIGECLLDASPECLAAWREVVPMYRAAIKLDRTRYDAVFGLGLAYLYSGRAGESVNYFKVAYSKTPWAIPVNFYLGESYRVIGDSRASLYLRNAHNWAQDELWRALTTAALARLEED